MAGDLSIQGDDRLMENAKVPASRTTRHPPGRVLWFERLFYCSVFLSFVRIIIEWPSGMELLSFVSRYTFLICQILLIWLAARRRKSWARWLLLIFFLVWAVTDLLRAGFDGRPTVVELRTIALQVMVMIQIALENIALILAFTGISRRWFNPHLHRQGEPVF